MFELNSLLIIICGTFAIYSWVFFVKDRLAKYFFMFFILMFLLYSGIGGALENTVPEYITYYFVFSICISIGIGLGFRCIHKARRNNRYRSWYAFLNYFMDKYAKKIVIAYLLLHFVNLLYPEFKLLNLIHPPSPDVISVLGERYQREAQSTFFSSIIYSLDNLLYPFFLFSLYRYRKKTILLCAILFGKYYIEYCVSGYLGRGDMLTGLIIVGAFTYFHRPKLGKIILVSSIVLIPLLLVFFVKYSVTRIGGSAMDISVGDATEMLLAQESSYPTHFDRITDITNHMYWANYLIWLFTLPLPGIVRGSMECNFNAVLSEYLLNISRSSPGFYILLPGIVGESVFLFGKSFFWINGIIYGFIMSATYRVISRFPQLFGLLIAAAICFSFSINRGGMGSGIPFILKILLYFYLILWYIKKRQTGKFI